MGVEIKPQLGGVRPGSGRPALGYIRKSVCLTPEQWDYIRDVGAGVDAEGLRRVVLFHQANSYLGKRK